MKRTIMTNTAWVDDTLRRMTVEEKAGQVLFPRIYGWFLGAEDETFLEYVRWVEQFHVGGLEMFFGDVYGAANLLNGLQARAGVPLLVSCDAETGMAHRIAGTTHLTHNMGLGASRNPRIAYDQGRITAEEGIALGVHLLEGPTLDVNTDPRNPIIAVRSFGDDPALVAHLGKAFIEGVQDHGMIACAKHFPGHGGTDVDSHMDMPVVMSSREELERTDLFPFRQAVESGVGAVMTAHIRTPALDPDTEYPATLSRAVTTGLLREDMGFDGLIMTDCMRMDGITKYFPPGEAELQSLLAGSDIILGPFLEETYARILDATRSGELPMERLDASIRRILRAKAWCGLDENRFVETGELPYRIASARTRNDARRIAESSITLLKNEDGFLPLDMSKYKRVLGILYYDHPLGDIGDAFLNALRRRATGLSAQFYQEGLTNESGNIRTAMLPADCDPRFEEDVIRETSSYDAVILAFVYRIIMRRNTPNLRPRAAAFAERLAATGVPVAAVSFGSPYVLGQVPGVRAFAAAYMYSPAVQEAAVRAVFGEIPFAGKVPVKMVTE